MDLADFCRAAQATAKARRKPSDATFAASRDITQILGETSSHPYSNAWTDSRIEQVRHFKHWVYVAVDRIATQIACQIPNVSFVTDDVRPHSGKSAYIRNKSLTPIQYHESLEPVKNSHPLVRLLKDPNTPDSAFDLWYETILFLRLTGSAYWYMPSNGLGLPSAIWVLPSHWVWPVDIGGATAGYELRPTDGNYLRKFIPEAEIVHFRHKNPHSKIDGYSPLTAGAQWVDTQESIDRTRWFSFKNGVTPGVAIEFGANFLDPSDVDLDRIEKKFLARYAGENRANKPMLLPPGTSFKKLSLSPAEMGYTESAIQSRDQILAMFGVPAVAAQISKDMTYGSVLAAQYGFFTQTINPLLNFLGQTITEKLARRYDDNLRVWWEDRSPEDPENRLKKYELAHKIGAVTPNEFRTTELGFEPYANGGNDPILDTKLGVFPLNSGGDMPTAATVRRDRPAGDAASVEDLKAAFPSRFSLNGHH